MDGIASSHGDVVDLEAERVKRLSCKRYTEVFNLIHSKWIGVLKLQETAVLQFVNVRTYKYGKPSEEIPRRHFLEGVYSREGNQLHAGLPIGETTLKSALRALEGYGLLEVTQIYYGNRQSSNSYEINFNKLEAGPDMSKLNMPKKMRGGSHNEGGGVAQRLKGGRIATTVNSISNKQIRSSITLPPPADGLDAAIKTAQTKNRESRQKKRATLNTRVTKSAVKALWQELMVEHFPHAPIMAMTDKEWGMFKKQYETINLHDHKLDKIITWIVTEWENLMKGQMSWVHKYEPSPYLPTVRVMCRFFRKFVEVYSSGYTREVQHDGSRVLAELKNNGDDRNEVAKLKAELEEAKRDRALALHDRDIAQRASRRRASTSIPIDGDLPEWGKNDGE